MGSQAHVPTTIINPTDPIPAAPTTTVPPPQGGASRPGTAATAEAEEGNAVCGGGLLCECVAWLGGWVGGGGVIPLTRPPPLLNVGPDHNAQGKDEEEEEDGEDSTVEEGGEGAATEPPRLFPSLLTIEGVPLDADEGAVGVGVWNCRMYLCMYICVCLYVQNIISDIEKFNLTHHAIPSIYPHHPLSLSLSHTHSNPTHCFWNAQERRLLADVEELQPWWARGAFLW